MKKLEKVYLRIFANIEIAEYSDDEKKVFIELLIKIANDQFKLSKLKYDISGSGYGISKGDGLFGEKSLKNKLNKKGYKNLYGFSVHSNGDTYKSGFIIYSNKKIINRTDIYFSWPYEDLKSIDKAGEIIKIVSEKIKIEYAYAYPDDKTLLENDESRISYGFFSVTCKVPEQERKWRDKLLEIPAGTIKKLYPFNVFNKKQIERLSNINPQTQIKLSDGNEVWNFDPATLDKENGKVKIKVID